MIFTRICLFGAPRTAESLFFYPDMSAIAKLVKKLQAMENRARQLSQKEVVVGWANEAMEQPRAKSKTASIAANTAKNVGATGRKKPRGEFVSNFDENFIGPGQQSASLATIAKVMCYGREGGHTAAGKEYGRIPARNFVEVLKNKHSKIIHRVVADEVIRKGADGSVNMVDIGRTAVGQLQRAMKDSNEYSPNAPFTINGGWMADPKTKKPFYAEPKGSNRPLWNTGNLITSVDFEIKDK